MLAPVQLQKGKPKHRVHHKYQPLHDKINPKNCQVLSLGDTGFLQFFRVVSRDYGKPRNILPFLGGGSWNVDRFSPIIVVVSWKMAGHLKANYYWKIHPFFHFHDYGRKGSFRGLKYTFGPISPTQEVFGGWMIWKSYQTRHFHEVLKQLTYPPWS